MQTFLDISHVILLSTALIVNVAACVLIFLWFCNQIFEGVISILKIKDEFIRFLSYRSQFEKFLKEKDRQNQSELTKEG